MPEIKNTFLKSKMNKDLDSRIISNGEYRDAQNASVSASEDASVGSLENIRGNSLITSFNLTDFNLEVIGQYSDTANNRMFFFLTNFSDTSSNSLSSTALPNASTTEDTTEDYTAFSRSGGVNYIVYCAIPNVNDPSEITLNSVNSGILVQGSFLNFSKTHPITGINIIEDLLFFTDNRNQPRKININRAIENSNYYTKEDNISVARYAPYSSISFLKKTNGPIESTMVNETEEYLPPFFGGPAQTVTGFPSSIGQVLRFNVSGGGNSQNYSYVKLIDFLGGLTTAQLNDVKVTIQSESNANDAFVRELITTASRNDLGLQTSSGNAITNIKQSLGWEEESVYMFSLKNPKYNPAFAGDKDLLEDKFVRFSYRFKYDDNEYSLTAPFSQHTFVPKQFGYFLQGDSNKAKDSSIVSFMENQISTVDLVIDLPYAPNTISKELKVKELQLLYKASDEENIKIIDDVDLQTTGPNSFQLGLPKTLSLKAGGGSGYTPASGTAFYYVSFTSSDYTNPNPLNIGSGLTAKITVTNGSVVSAEIASGSRINLGQIPPTTDIVTSTAASVQNLPISSSNQSATFMATSGGSGGVTTLTCLTGGSNYSVGDVIVFDASAFNPTSGTLSLTLTAEMLTEIGGSGENYRVGDSLDVPALPLQTGTGSGAKILIGSLENTYIYKYSSQKPIKVLTSKEVTRVSDIIPMRAQTQEAVGNRIIYGNFLQNNSTPTDITYSLSTVIKGSGTSETDREYNNSSLKQGRSYQVGLVLQDRYGRSSNVIVNDSSTSSVTLNSTIFNKYTNGGTNPLGWPGESLEIIIENTINTVKTSTYNGIYSEDNPLGWYSYKVVVQQQEQDYYNVYTAGALSGNIIYTKNDAEKDEIQDGQTVKIKGLRYSGTSEIFSIALFNDNINKIPRELNEVGPSETVYSSNVVLYNRVKNTELDTDLTIPNISVQNERDDILKQEVNTIRPFKELGQWTDYKNIDLHYLHMDPDPNAPDPRSQYESGTFIYPGVEGEVDPFYLENNKNPLIATVSTKNRMGFSKKNQEYNSTTGFNFAKELMVFETKPFKSNLDIYYETSTSGLISELNFAIENDLDPTGNTVLGDIDPVTCNWVESDTVGTVISNNFSLLNVNGLPLEGSGAQFTTISIESITDGNNNNVDIDTDPPIEIVEISPFQSPNSAAIYALKLLNPNDVDVPPIEPSNYAGEGPFKENSNSLENYTVVLKAIDSNSGITKTSTCNVAKTNLNPFIYRFQGFSGFNTTFDNRTDGIPNQMLVRDTYQSNSVTGGINLRQSIEDGNEILTRINSPSGRNPSSNFYTGGYTVAAVDRNDSDFNLCLSGQMGDGRQMYPFAQMSHYTNGFESLSGINFANFYQNPSTQLRDTDIQNLAINSANYSPSNSAVKEARRIQGLIPYVSKAERYDIAARRLNVPSDQRPTKKQYLLKKHTNEDNAGDYLKEKRSEIGKFRFVQALPDDTIKTSSNNTFTNIWTVNGVVPTTPWVLFWQNDGKPSWGSFPRSRNQGYEFKGAWIYFIEVKLRDASGTTNSLESNTYGISFVISK